MLLLVILTYKRIKVRGGRAGSRWSAVPSPPRQLPGELGVSGEVAESGGETGERGGPGLAALHQCTGAPGGSRLQGRETPRVAARQLQTPVGGLPFSVRDL